LPQTAKLTIEFDEGGVKKVLDGFVAGATRRLPGLRGPLIEA